MLPTLSRPFARSRRPELLDGEALDRQELAANLRELAALNRLPGGSGASIAAIERLAGRRRELAILDVGTGGGDMPVAFARRGRRGGRWAVVAVDSRPEILAVARSGLAGRDRDVQLRLADGRRLPFADGTFDVAHASLVVHHLEEADATRMLAEMRRVARLGVVINDLQRGVGHFLVTAATVLALSRSRYTRHDGVLSARRAYTRTELHALLRATRLEVAWQSSPLAPRLAIAARDAT